MFNQFLVSFLSQLFLPIINNLVNLIKACYKDLIVLLVYIKVERYCANYGDVYYRGVTRQWGRMWLQGLPGYWCCCYSLQLLLHLLEVIPYVLLVCSFPYRSDLRDLDVVYAAFCPASIRRVLFKRIALGEYLCWYGVPTSLIVGIFLGEGQVAVSNILLIDRVSLRGQYLVVSPNLSNKGRQFWSILQLDKLSLLNI